MAHGYNEDANRSMTESGFFKLATLCEDIVDNVYGEFGVDTWTMKNKNQTDIKMIAVNLVISFILFINFIQDVSVTVAKRYLNSVLTFGGIQVLEMMQVMLETSGGSVNWPTSAFLEGIWIKLNLEEKLVILKRLDQGTYNSKSTKVEDDGEERFIKISSSMFL